VAELGGPEGPNEPAPADLTRSELLDRLQTSEDGLADDEAQRRLDQYGPNEIPEKTVSPVLAFLLRFWGPIPWMIEIAAILSAVVHHWTDFAIIGVLLIMNAIVGFWEEYQASNTIAALKAKLALQARVRRSGRWRSIPARELVPGDVVRLRIGEVVPADARLLDGDPVQVDQSALTGESLPVERKSDEAVYAGSVVKQGEIEAVVQGTGAHTYFGRTADLVEQAQTVSHFQRAVLRIGNYLIVLAAVLAAAIITVALLRGDRLMTTLQFVLVLTVAAVPVAMPTVLSVTMAVGARRLAHKQAVVTRLASIEEMAGIGVLCSDKTGTLTQNRLTLGEPFTVEGVSAEEAIVAAALASREEDNDPIDTGVLSGLRDKQELQTYHVTHFTPFDPVHKRTEAVVTAGNGHEFRVAKGAAQVILELVNPDAGTRSAAEQAVNEFASRGFRSLGVARADGEDGWRLLGVLPLFDPPREDSKETIEAARGMGVETKMVTGDQAAIARETSRQLGLGENVLSAQVLGEGESAQDDAMIDHVEAANGFAQVFPEHKFLIVKALQKRGHIVGMTGDGVNDAPALKQADAGIAVSAATDAARAAADIALLAPGLSVIIDAIRESRRSFQRMTNYAIYRIAETIRVLLFMTLSILVFNFYPVTAVMIVLLALLNDGAILSIAYDNVVYSNRPERWNMRVVLGLATVLGVFGVIASFLLFFLCERVFHLSRDVIQSLMYLKLSVAGHLTVFVARTRGPFWSIKPSRLLLSAVIGTQIAATLIVVFGVFMPAVPWTWAAAVWGYALVWFVLGDGIKQLSLRILDPPDGSH
jgi:H+-transporting ATPase